MKADAILKGAIRRFQAGDAAAAADLCLEVLEVDARNATAHSYLGVFLQKQGKLAEAASSLIKAVECDPEYAGAYGNLGIVLAEIGRVDEAARSFREAVRLAPHSAEAHHNLANLLRDKGAPGEAAVYYQRAIALKPDLLATHMNLGRALLDLGAVDEALKSYERALNLSPDDPDAHYYVANALALECDFRGALRHFDSAIRLRPAFAEARFHRAMVWLKLGDFENGWREYEWRTRLRGGVRELIATRRWDGARLPQATLVLRAEQGLGDLIQFVRYAPLVRARVGRVLLECPTHMFPLIRHCRGVDGVCSSEDAIPEAEAEVSLLSVPGIVGTRAGSIPADCPYLFADRELTRRWQCEVRRHSGFKIGVCWQGSATYAGDRYRSIPLGSFAAIARVRGVQLFSLQKGPGTDQMLTSHRQFNIVDFGADLDGDAGAFMDTAAIMQNLDLVLTADTAVAHLAGALGVPVWVALPYSADWRWLIDREDSPWYPTMRLFRQSKTGEWGRLFACIAHEIENRLR